MPVIFCCLLSIFQNYRAPIKLFTHSLVPKGMARSYVSEVKALVFAEAANSCKFGEVRS